MCADRCYPHRTRCCTSCPDLEVQANSQFGSGLILVGFSPTSLCVFPDCPEEARPDHATCELHQRVTVTGSWVESAKHEDDGGS